MPPLHAYWPADRVLRASSLAPGTSTAQNFASKTSCQRSPRRQKRVTRSKWSLTCARARSAAGTGWIFEVTTQCTLPPATHRRLRSRMKDRSGSPRCGRTHKCEVDGGTCWEINEASELGTRVARLAWTWRGMGYCNCGVLIENALATNHVRLSWCFSVLNVRQCTGRMHGVPKVKLEAESASNTLDRGHAKLMTTRQTWVPYLPVAGTCQTTYVDPLPLPMLFLPRQVSCMQTAGIGTYRRFISLRHVTSRKDGLRIVAPTMARTRAMTASTTIWRAHRIQHPVTCAGLLTSFGNAPSGRPKALRCERSAPPMPTINIRQPEDMLQKMWATHVHRSNRRLRIHSQAATSSAPRNSEAERRESQVLTMKERDRRDEQHESP